MTRCVLCLKDRAVAKIEGIPMCIDCILKQYPPKVAEKAKRNQIFKHPLEEEADPHYCDTCGEAMEILGVDERPDGDTTISFICCNEDCPNGRPRKGGETNV